MAFRSEKEAPADDQIGDRSTAVVSSCEQADRLISANQNEIEMTTSQSKLDNNNDLVIKDISRLVSNFQQQFITFTKNNFETFTEKDV